MKAIQVRSLENSAVRGMDEVRLSATKEETDELRRALAIVDKCEKVALAAAKRKMKEADYTTFHFAVKSDCVYVTIEQGSCG